ncbi:hypothetical protein QH494_13705 [Sphingomonas sp. AR_OL41]|uniref:hypothetical protein n=1 Tax=Sphingomonas sp. AR_OL41 TaxID=3042729 RepID=UPI0024811F78|nr:hypothetical protein [Sphingomonas sp. AR_OL41]MDH7973239.1 hypothetical protein [Sphingomonas sp. AR_OL41]
MAMAALAVLAVSPARPADKPVTAGAAPVVILHQDVPLFTIYAWERWGNFINAEAGSKTEIPYDAARLQVKVYTFPSGEIRAIRFGNGVRTHRHINQTDTILYSWQAHRVHFVDDQAMVTEPGDFALHQKGVYHSGEETRHGGGIDLEFAMTIPGRHNDPHGYWSLARDHPVQPAAAWQLGGVYQEAIGPAAANAPAGATRFRVRLAELPDYQAREVYLPAGATIAGRLAGKDRLFFVASGRVTATAGGTGHALVSEDTAWAEHDQPFAITAREDSMIVEAFVPPRAAP